MPSIAVAWPQDRTTSRPSTAPAPSSGVADTGPRSAARALSSLRGLLLTGGVDVDPAHYGDAERHPTVEIDAGRDEYELALARAALAARSAVLAICRGVQVLNVAAGGTLVQDLPSQHSTTLPHAAAITTAADSSRTRLCRAGHTPVAPAGGPPRRPSVEIDVNSRHHQAVETTCARLRRVRPRRARRRRRGNRAPARARSASACSGIRRTSGRLAISVRCSPRLSPRRSGIVHVGRSWFGACSKVRHAYYTDALARLRPNTATVST